MPTITETVGDIFTAPADSILIHACNAKGAWGSGVALEFKKRYPQAFKTYTTHCKSPPKGTPPAIHQRSLAGTCLLIPPASPQPETPRHYVACLITSVGYGKNVDGAETILQNTASALRDLAVRITGLRGKGWDGEVWAVRINSGKFGVEWRRTRAVLEGGEVGMKVMAPKEEEGEGSEEGGEGGGERGDVMVTQPAKGEKDRDDRGGTGDSEGNWKIRNEVGHDESRHGKRARLTGNEVDIKGVDTTAKLKPGRGKRVRVGDGGAGDGDCARAKARPRKQRGKSALEDT